MAYGLRFWAGRLPGARLCAWFETSTW